MQLFHAYRHTRRLSTFLRPTTPLLRTLYTDGFAYFVIVVTLRLWSALIVSTGPLQLSIVADATTRPQFITADTSYWYISTYLEFSLISTSVSRLVLHLRRIAEVNHTLGPDDSIPLSRMTQDHLPPGTPGHARNARGGRGERRPPHARDISSSFQNPAYSVYSYEDPTPAPFSSSAYLRASVVSGAEGGLERTRETSPASPVSPGTADLLMVPGNGQGHQHGHGHGHGHGRVGSESTEHRCELCFDGGGTGAGKGGDHSYSDLLPTAGPRNRSREMMRASGMDDAGDGEKRPIAKVEAPAISNGIG